MNFREFVEKLQVAHVGASRDSRSGFLQNNDMYHFRAVVDWLNKCDPKMLEMLKNREDEFFDLNSSEDEDFLADYGHYDIVILHYLFDPLQYNDLIHQKATLDNYSKRRGEMRVSALHTKEAWRTRLEFTHAKYIFAFGDHGEVSGQFIGNIPGYTGPETPRWLMSVWTKQDYFDANPHEELEREY